MKIALLLSFFAIVFLAGSISQAHAAVDMFIKIGDIKGESTDVNHKDEIVIESWSWGMTNAGSASPPSVQSFVFTKVLDKSSPILMKKLLMGEHIPEATFVVRKAGEMPLEYLVIKMTDVLVSGYNVGGSGGEDRPTENITLNFAKVEVKYVPQKADGSADVPVMMCYDIARSISCG